eukprot:TRINITY_DN151690_c0_g2_i1.p1 TRINITY_DN151690_c0_g2~~TRINITY_DN151690_c0_g2_i1.p1  ORF type:complete len:278 (-),score=36.62 TRINITY_DN151690_c0_g2_i1:225-1058(-)
MYRIKNFAICIIAMTLIYACSKSEEEQFIEESKTDEFFKMKPDNENVQLLYDYLKNSDENKEKIANNIWGTPYWNREMAYTSNGKNMFVLPLADETSKQITSILVIGVDNNTIDYGMHVNDEDRYPTEDFGWIFAYFMQKIFNINENLKFVDLPQKAKGDKTKGWGVSCTEVYAGNDKIGWFKRNTNCVTLYIPSVPMALLDRDGSEEEYSGSFSNPGSPSLPPAPAPPVIEDKSWEDTKADCVKEKLETGGSNSILNKLLNGFELDNSDEFPKDCD